LTDAIDIYRAANLAIDRHGEEASPYAAARTAVLTGEGDFEGAAVCVRSLLRSRSCNGRGGWGRR
jgi:hypothetical protein